MLKIGIIGLPQTGKKQLFALLTGVAAKEAPDNKKPLLGVAEIKDSRFEYLAGFYKSKKLSRAKIDVALLPKIEKDAIAKGDIFKDISNMDALCHVARAFKDDSIYHIKGALDPERDIREINNELIMHDLIFIEKRLERLKETIAKAGTEIMKKENVLLLKLHEQLEKEQPLRLMKLEPQELVILSSYPLLTLKEMVVLLNVSEDDLKADTLLKQLEGKFAHEKIFFMQACLKTEAEIAAFEDDEEKKEFLSALSITEPAIDCLSRLLAKALGLISFFTAGPQEVRQWTIKNGANAVEAAGAIHSDLARGFIRAEIMKYADLESFSSEEKVKSAGKYYVKGKDYIIEDGDIVFIRFSV